MTRQTVSIAATAIAAFILAEPASGQTRDCATACVYEAVLEHVQSTAPESQLVLFRWVSLHEQCAADYRACRRPREKHPQALIDRLQDVGLIATTYEMVNDSLVWQDTRPDRPAAVSLGPLVPVEDFPEIVPPHMEVLKSVDPESDMVRIHFSVGVIVNVRSETTSYRYFLSRRDDGSCEVVYRMVTGMV